MASTLKVATARFWRRPGGNGSRDEGGQARRMLRLPSELTHRRHELECDTELSESALHVCWYHASAWTRSEDEKLWKNRVDVARPKVRRPDDHAPGGV